MGEVMRRVPAVSVVMSVHNGARYLRAAIESILAQTLGDLELIVVDDASTDGSGETCREYAERDARVVHLANAARRGLTPSLNRALAEARGSFVARMDADDISLPQRLETQVKYLENHRDVGLVGSFYTEIDERGDVLVPVYRFATEPIVIYWRMAFENPIPHPPIVARRELIDRVGRYDERWRTAQDFDLFTRLAAITKLANLPDVLFRWRRHPESVSAGLAREQRESAVRISRAHVERVIGHSVPQDLAELLWRRDPAGLDEAIRFVSAGVALCRRITAEPRWSRRERGMLRRHVSRRLLYELTPYSGTPRSWRPLVTVASLNPSLVVEVAGRWRH